MTHKAGFVNIIGRPNVGKSTLANILVGEKLSIITSKAQTTRHRILGIVNHPNYQFVFSDTPGLIDKPAYKLQESMNAYVSGTFKDADVILFVTDFFQIYKDDDTMIATLKNSKKPIVVILNKTDLYTPTRILEQIKYWDKILSPQEIIPISALKKHNTKSIISILLNYLPLSPAYYDKDALTDRPVRFFVSEIIREKIFLLYDKEIPYSSEVEIQSFKESGDIIRIEALIYVERKTQKSILIGKGGGAIKKMGIAARKDLETFFEKKIFLETFVKVREKWRNNDRDLKNFGYLN